MARPDILNMTAEVRPAEDMATLAAIANAEHERGELSIRKPLEHFRKAGEALLKARGQCSHGKWQPWAKKHLRFSLETACRYMRLAKRWDKDNLSSMTDLADALRFLSQKTGNKPRGKAASGKWSIDDDILRLRTFIQKSRERWKTDRDKDVLRSFLNTILASL